MAKTRQQGERMMYQEERMIAEAELAARQAHTRVLHGKAGNVARDLRIVAAERIRDAANLLKEADEILAGVRR